MGVAMLQAAYGAGVDSTGDAWPGTAVERLRTMVGGDWDLAAVLESTGSTNDDAAALDVSGPVGGDRLGRVVVADHQAAGRGRLGRQWSAPPRTSVAVSVIVRPDVPPAAWGWLPLLAGQAVREAVAALLPAPAQARIKWPNDVVVTGPVAAGKVCGLLTEVRGRGVVIGAGINTNLTVDQRPVDTATSLMLVTHRVVDPTLLVGSYLGRLASWWRAWVQVAGDAEACGLLAAHRQWSDTIGRDVRVAVPGGGSVEGQARGVDIDGRLLVDVGGGRITSLGAGDVVTVR